jgi:protein SCO1/2
VLIAVLSLGYYYYQSLPPKPTALVSATITANQQMLPEFKLTDDNNHAFTRDDFRGHWSFLFFGYTNCPTSCSTILAKLNHVYTTLQQKNITPLPQVVFISLDPEHDTAEQIKNYLQNFNPHFIGATGNMDEINKLTHLLGIYYAFAKMDDGTPYISHSSTIVVINPRGEWIASLLPPHYSQTLLENYLRIINKPQSLPPQS